MRSVLQLFCCAAMFAATNVSAQQFINGGFEPKTTITPCTAGPVATYNSNMGGNWARGGMTTMKLANASCSQGAPVAGSYFGIMEYSAPVTNTIVFKLDKALTVNTPYSIILSYKVPTGATTMSATLRYGYGKDSLSSDSISGYEPVAITTTAWKKDTLTFTPKQAWQHVWVEVGTLGGDPFELHIDDLSMMGIAPVQPPSSSVNEVAVNPAMVLAPNPFNNSTTLTVNETVAKPYAIQVYDVTGRVVMQQDNLDKNQVTINRDNLQTGVYILKLVDADQQVATSRLSVQ